MATHGSKSSAGQADKAFASMMHSLVYAELPALDPQLLQQQPRVFQLRTIKRSRVGRARGLEGGGLSIVHQDGGAFLGQKQLPREPNMQFSIAARPAHGGDNTAVKVNKEKTRSGHRRSWS